MHEVPGSGPLTDAEKDDAASTREQMVKFTREQERKLERGEKLNPSGWTGRRAGRKTEGNPGRQT